MEVHAYKANHRQKPTSLTGAIKEMLRDVLCAASMAASVVDRMQHALAKRLRFELGDS